jgi:hypothetical protein
MFGLGTTTMTPRAQALLAEVGKTLASMPNKVAIRGHTDSLKFANTDGKNNWALSAERAEETRKIIEKNGIPESRFAKIEGVADTAPYNPNDPKDGHYISFKTKSHRDLTLCDAQGLVTSNQAAAATATLTAWSGQKFVFQIVTINGVRVGRMTQLADRNGFGIAITYKYQPGDDLGGSEARLWQLDTATDPYGVQAQFTYNPLQVAGRWVVSQIAVASGAMALTKMEPPVLT